MTNTEDIGVNPAKDRDKALSIEINKVFDHLQHHSLESAMEMLQSGKLDGFASHDAISMSLELLRYKPIYGQELNMKYPVVKIEWLDSRQPTSNWHLAEDFEDIEACHCVTVGFLINNGEVKQVALSIADTDDDSPQVSGVVTIPVCCIQQLTILADGD